MRQSPSSEKWGSNNMLSASLILRSLRNTSPWRTTNSHMKRLYHTKSKPWNSWASSSKKVRRTWLTESVLYKTKLTRCIHQPTYNSSKSGRHQTRTIQACLNVSNSSWVNLKKRWPKWLQKAMANSRESLRKYKKLLKSWASWSRRLRRAMLTFNSSSENPFSQRTKKTNWWCNIWSSLRMRASNWTKNLKQLIQRSEDKDLPWMRDTLEAKTKADRSPDRWCILTWWRRQPSGTSSSTRITSKTWP